MWRARVPDAHAILEDDWSRTPVTIVSCETVTIIPHGWSMCAIILASME